MPVLSDSRGATSLSLGFTDPSFFQLKTLFQLKEKAGRYGYLGSWMRCLRLDIEENDLPRMIVVHGEGKATQRYLITNPLAHERPDLSPYNYAQNNPILRIDPTGMPEGEYYDEEGNDLGSDGVDEGLVHIIDKSDNNRIAAESSIFSSEGKEKALSSAVTSTSGSESASIDSEELGVSIVRTALVGAAGSLDDITGAGDILKDRAKYGGYDTRYKPGSPATSTVHVKGPMGSGIEVGKKALGIVSTGLKVGGGAFGVYGLGVTYSDFNNRLINGKQASMDAFFGGVGFAGPKGAIISTSYSLGKVYGPSKIFDFEYPDIIMDLTR